MFNLINFQQTKLWKERRPQNGGDQKLILLLSFRRKVILQLNPRKRQCKFSVCLGSVHFLIIKKCTMYIMSGVCVKSANLSSRYDCLQGLLGAYYKFICLHCWQIKSKWFLNIIYFAFKVDRTSHRDSQILKQNRFPSLFILSLI